MITTQPQPDDFAQRLSKMRRLLNAMSLALDALESDYAIRYNGGAARPVGEVAAQRARDAAQQTGPLEVKVQ